MSMSWKYSLPAVAGLALAALLPPAIAQQTATPDDRIRAAFKDADINGDGYVNIDEYVGYIVLQFARLDRNRDGYLATSELPKDHDPARARAADRNGDGRLSLGEIVGDRIVDFFEADTNHDGVITVEELLIYERTVTTRK